MIPTYAHLGSISEGTLRTDDLLRAFLDALDALRESRSFDCIGSPESEMRNAETHGREDSELGEIERNLTEWAESEQDESSSACIGLAAQLYSDLESVDEMLSEYVPPLCYFGTAEGDGACFGFWLECDAIERAKDEPEEYALVSDTSELQDGTEPFALLINDHGNVTLYAREILSEDPTVYGSENLAEVWSVV